MFFVEEEEKKKKSDKYLDECYYNIIAYVSNEICNKFCSGCEYYNAPKFTHICLLSKIDKIDIFGKEATGIAIKCGLISKTFREKITKKNVFTSDEIDELIQKDMDTPKKFKDIKKMFELESI